MLSLGAFAENLSIAARTFGLKAEMEVIAKEPFEPDVIKVALKKAKPVDYPLQRITRRLTVKQGYLPKEIKAEDIRALSEHLKGRLFYFPRGTDHATCIEEGVIENFRLQTQRDDAQKELVQWVRISNKEAERRRDGRTLEGVEIHSFKGWFVRNFIDPEDFMKPSFRKQSVDQVAKLARQGGGWLVITGEGQTVSDFIDSDRCFSPDKPFNGRPLRPFRGFLPFVPMVQYTDPGQLNHLSVFGRLGLDRAHTMKASSC